VLTRRTFCASSLVASVLGHANLAFGDEKRAVCYNCVRDWADWKGQLEALHKATGIVMPTDNRNSGEALASMIAERANPVADAVYFGGDFAIRAKEDDLIVPYKSKYWNEVPDGLKDPDGYWTALHTGSICFFVNKDALGTTPIPRSWADLTKPDYSGLIGYYDIATSALGYVTALAMNSALGGTLENYEPALRYLKQLQTNKPLVPRNTSYQRVISGEIPILVEYDSSAYRAKYRENAPIEVVIPTEGTVTVPYVITLAKNAPHSDLGKQMIDFTLSDEGQRLWAAAFMRPVREQAMTPEIGARFLPASDYARSKPLNLQAIFAGRDHFKAFVEQYQKEIG
jgi:putative spermidine/putrescine transport system substrate-binding protein